MLFHCSVLLIPTLLTRLFLGLGEFPDVVFKRIVIKIKLIVRKEPSLIPVGRELREYNEIKIQKYNEII